MAQALGSRYRLKVRAGTEYDPSTHQEVEVNGRINTLVGDWGTVNVAVRVQNYHGMSIAPISFVHSQSSYALRISIIISSDQSLF